MKNIFAKIFIYSSLLVFLWGLIFTYLRRIVNLQMWFFIFLYSGSILFVYLEHIEESNRSVICLERVNKLGEIKKEKKENKDDKDQTKSVF